jgi:hypothetical protein
MAPVLAEVGSSNPAREFAVQERHRRPPSRHLVKAKSSAASLRFVLNLVAGLFHILTEPLRRLAASSCGDEQYRDKQCDE